jgi:transcriptional regulator with XRE-family HTH domain
MNGQVPRPSRSLMRPGAVSGAVLRAARLSAGVSEAVLASAAGVTEAAIRGWEDGSRALATERYSRVEQLERALRVVEADARLVADLAPAAWCDLVLAALMSDGEGDLASLLADPLAAGEAFGELFAWAVDGRVPVRSRPFVVDGALIVFPRVALTAVVLKLVDVVRRFDGSAGQN